ncbi:MAG: M67 family metallopeptidase [Candidatus Omnitrophica bacterium]|nr:M67 family metallopeptidase [Candidatus Omnitrophota bacterium]
MFEQVLPEIPKEILADLYKHAEETYPGECCGFLLGEKLKAAVETVRRLKNVYDEFRAKDPETYPRTNRTAYLIEPVEILKVQRETRNSGIELKVIYHSHIDVGAYFSDEDKRAAIMDGQPAFPGVAYLVISCRNGRSDNAALFAWDEAKSDFILRQSF